MWPMNFFISSFLKKGRDEGDVYSPYQGKTCAHDQACMLVSLHPAAPILLVLLLYLLPAGALSLRDIRGSCGEVLMHDMSQGAS